MHFSIIFLLCFVCVLPKPIISHNSIAFFVFCGSTLGFFNKFFLRKSKNAMDSGGGKRERKKKNQILKTKEK